MAATVEGIFRIIDRASGPMERMERQAKQTDRAMAHLALTTDMVGNGKQQQQLQKTDQLYRNFGRTIDDTGGRVRRINRDLDQHESRWVKVRSALTNVGGALAGVSRIWSYAKFPAMIAGIGVLVQSVGALAGGVIGLLPRLGQLSGMFAGLVGPIAGMGLAMGTVKLAFSGFSQAMSGNLAALAKLDPAARRFLATLRSYHGVARQLRESAQGGLFGGLNEALPLLTRALPLANVLLSKMSSTLGGLAKQFAQRITGQGALSNLLAIGNAGNRSIGGLGTSLINIGGAVAQIARAAIPFSDAMTRGAVALSKWVENWATFNRDSGRTQAFLHNTNIAMRQFGSILKNLWGFFSGLLRAAKPLGDLLWGDVERGTKAWSKYANSVQGQVKLTRMFLQMYPAVKAIVTLFDNLVKAIFQMGTQQQLGGIVTSLSGIVPGLEKLLNMFVTQFGPVLANLIGNLVPLFTFLTSATGPLNIMLTLFSNIVGMVDKLLRIVPGLGSALGAVVSVVGIGLMISRVQGLAGAWFGVASGANAAAAAEARATGVGLAGGAGGGALNRAMSGGGLAAGAEGAFLGSVTRPNVRSAFGPIEGATMNTSQFAVRPALYSGGEGFTLAEGAGIFSGASRGATALGAGGRLLGAAGKFALPITAALGAYGALTAPTSGGFLEQAAQRTYAGANAITFGGYGAALRGLGVNTSAAIMTPDQLANRNIKRSTGASGTFGSAISNAGGTDPHTRAQISRQIALYEQQIADYSQRQGPAYKAAADGLRQQLDALRAVGEQLRRNQAFTERGGNAKFLRQEGGAFSVLSKANGNASAAMSTNRDVLSRLRTLKSPQARQSLAQNYLSWLTGEDKRDPKAFAAALQQFESHVGGTLGVPHSIAGGRITTGTAASFNAVRSTLLNPVERARERTSKGLTAAQEKAVVILSLLGAPSAYAASLVAEIEHMSIGAATAMTAGLGSRVHAPAGVSHAAAGNAGSGLPGGASAAGTGGPSNGIWSGVQSGIHGVANRVMNRFPGLGVTSTLRAGDTGSYHSLGEAVDLAGPPGLMSQAAQWINATMGGSLLEGIHQNGLSIKNGKQVPSSFWGANTWAQHRNHIHLAFAGAGGAGLLGSGQSMAGTGLLASPMASSTATPAGGLPGVFADQAGLLSARRRAGISGLAASPVAGAVAAMTSSAGSSSTNMALARRMMLAHGWGGGQWPALRSLWTGESHFNANAINPSSHAQGIPQFLPMKGRSTPAGFPDHGPINAAAQIKWGLDYISGRYGTPGAAYSAWSGREPHWYGNGGDFIAKKPMLIGVGDNPRGERVTITPGSHHGSSTGGGQPVQLSVHIGTIENHRDGDIVKIVHSEFEALARLLEQGTTQDDSGTML